MKVIHILGPLRPSGWERMLVSAQGHFADLGVSNEVIGQGVANPYANAMRVAGIDVHLVPSLRTVRGLTALLRLLRAQPPGIVHIHTEAAFGAVALISRLACSAPIVRTIHNQFNPSGWRWRASRRLQRLVGDRWVSAFVVPSADVAENERRHGRRAVVIENWVDDAFARLERTPERPGPPLAVIVGNCSEIKNHTLALEAALAVSALQVAHVGITDLASPEERSILQSLEDLGRLVARGPGDPLPWLQQADVFLMPSIHEGMPVALMEALVGGVRAVVTPAPGMTWAQVIPGVAVADFRVDDWVRAIQSTVGSDEKVPRVELAQRFSAERGAREYGDLYLRLGSHA